MPVRFTGKSGSMWQPPCSSRRDACLLFPLRYRQDMRAVSEQGKTLQDIEARYNSLYTMWTEHSITEQSQHRPGRTRPLLEPPIKSILFESSSLITG